MRTAEQIETDLPVPRNLDVIQLPLGLLGFERIKEYVWEESEDELPFRWLRAVQDPTLTFLVVSPFEVLSEYEPDVSEEDVSFLGLNMPMDALVLSIVTLRPGGRATANLKGPIILNRFTRRGKQVVLSNAADYPLQFPLPTAE
jgi:flagellar assembly factor FliW